MGMLQCSTVQEKHAEKTDMTCSYVKHRQKMEKLSLKFTKTENKSHKALPTLKFDIVLNVKIKGNKIQSEKRKKRMLLWKDGNGGN